MRARAHPRRSTRSSRPSGRGHTRVGSSVAVPTRAPADTPHAPSEHDGIAHALARRWSRSLFSEVANRSTELWSTGQVVSVLMLPLVLLTGVFIDEKLGYATLGLTLLSFAWYTLRRHAIGDGLLERATRAASPWICMTFPIAIMALFGWCVSGEEALAAPVPVLLSILIITLSTTQVRPWVPMALGLYAAIARLFTYLTVVADRSAETIASTPALSITWNATHITVLAVTGAACSMAAFGAQRALEGALASLRERDLFGKYRLHEVLGVGGMGEVLRATYCPEGGFERPVAIKRVHPHLAGSERFVKSFRKEAELCAALLHPNIVSVIDFGRAGGDYFLVMEHVDGESLAQLIDERAERGARLPPAVVGALVRQLLEGLHFAHTVAVDRTGAPLCVVHRDLSPNNIMLSRAGQVKILDYGLATALGDRPDHRTEHLAGSLAYMAPEQVGGGIIDPRTDLFAVGAVAWELLTGAPLFQHATRAATLRAVADAIVPALVDHGVTDDGRWQRWLERALARSPERRFGSAAAMAAALDGLLHDSPRVGPAELRALVATEDRGSLSGFALPRARSATTRRPSTVVSRPSMEHEATGVGRARAGSATDVERPPSGTPAHHPARRRSDTEQEDLHDASTEIFGVEIFEPFRPRSDAAARDTEKKPAAPPPCSPVLASPTLVDVAPSVTAMKALPRPAIAGCPIPARVSRR
jgi:serine/threonine protein kinase